MSLLFRRRSRGPSTLASARLLQFEPELTRHDLSQCFLLVRWLLAVLVSPDLVSNATLRRLPLLRSGFIVSPWAQIESAYTNSTELSHAVGFFLFGWFIFTFISKPYCRLEIHPRRRADPGLFFAVFIASLRSSIALSGIFFFLTITFMLLGIAEFVPSHAVAIKTAGGALGLVTAANAW